MSEPILQARDIWLEYDGGRTVLALRGIDMAVEAGAFLGIMGPSGSGKSSLFHVLAGLRRPTRGLVTFLSAPWPFPIGRGALRRRASLGFVFQEPFLIPHWTVAENIRVQACTSNPGRIDRLGADLGIAHLLDEFPDRLSAGERQRVSVARALVNDPVLVLADEPTACLDTENGRNVMKILTESIGRAALVVCSHDSRMLAGATRVYRMEDGAFLSPT